MKVLIEQPAAWRLAVAAAARKARVGSAAVAAAVVAPATLLGVLLLSAGCCLTAGVYLLAGLGWAVVAAGVLQLALAVVLLRGGFGA